MQPVSTAAVPGEADGASTSGKGSPGEPGFEGAVRQPAPDNVKQAPATSANLSPVLFVMTILHVYTSRGADARFVRRYPGFPPNVVSARPANRRLGSHDL
ncbi:MAG: hypothetical protein BroJett003_09800 [Planctomycetota bacterium]|nr:MAG: hypothetical protein BroJett003_09800 [Planctomycetota bacterium]